MELTETTLKNYQDEVNELNKLKSELNEKRDEFNNANKTLIVSIQEKTNETNLHQAELKEGAVDVFDETGEKKLLGGIGIRVGTLLKYEPSNALAWAKEHQLCLSLNTREFEKIAKTQDIEFVEKKQKITATFPKEIIFPI